MNTAPVKEIKLKANGEWGAGVRPTIKVPGHARFSVDLPTEMGGHDYGPCPMEYMLGALIGCELFTMAGVAKEMNFTYEGVEVLAEGDIDPRGMAQTPGIKPYFHEVRQVIRVQTKESQERLNQLSQTTEARCPAFNLWKDAGVRPYVSWEVH
ncbi:MAG TPA: OsmC family protein [Bacillota bacterium]|nr:OsmC family protein [Bacillota bacterium]